MANITALQCAINANGLSKVAMPINNNVCVTVKMFENSMSLNYDRDEVS